jgi:hypothetical protein
MITGNVMDTYKVFFEDGQSVSLVAATKEKARWLAAELQLNNRVVRVERIGEWNDGEGNDH